MNTPRDKALDRARKLSAIARDQIGKPEGDTAAGLAAALAAKWHFTEADLQVEAQDGPVLFRALVEFGEPRLQARAFLLNALATIADCLSSFRLREPSAEEPEGVWFARVFGEDEARVELVVSVFSDLEQWLERRMVQSRAWKNIQEAIARAEAPDSKLPRGFADRIRPTLDVLRRNWWMTVTIELVRLWQARLPPDDGEGGELKPAEWDEQAQAPAPETALAVGQATARDALAKKTNKVEPEPWTFDYEAARAIQGYPWPFKDK